MVDLLSSPILVTIILGSVGLAIPAIDAGRREKVGTEIRFTAQLPLALLFWLYPLSSFASSPVKCYQQWHSRRKW